MDQHALASRAAPIRERFPHRFGQPPQWLAEAPGRVNLIGEHTDYNDGFVLPMAIERRTLLAAAPSAHASSSPTIRIFSENLQQEATFPLELDTPWDGPPWVNYARGVFLECARQGMITPSLDVLIDSDVPLGGGLSSSAALEVAVATLIEAVTGKMLSTLDKALLCQKAEHDYAHMPCGIMDQYIAAAAREGQLILLDCRSLQARPVSMDDPSVSVLIIDSQVKHELATGQYAKRREACEQAAAMLGVDKLRDTSLRAIEAARAQLGDRLYRRAKHVVTENDRTQGAAAAIETRNWPTAGNFMYESHDSLRDDYEVSCAELDLLVTLAKNIGFAGGVYGARMTGGGFGGCTVNLVQTDKVGDIAHAITTAYQRETGIQPAAFATRPAGGASILPTPH